MLPQKQTKRTEVVTMNMMQKRLIEEVTILGGPGLFAECCSDDSLGAEGGLYRYELRHGDEDRVIRYHCHGIS